MCIACLGSCGFLVFFLFKWKKDLLGVEKKLVEFDEGIRQ